MKTDPHKHEAIVTHSDLRSILQLGTVTSLLFFFFFFFAPKLWKQVDAVNKYDPPPEVVAANDHMTQIMYGMLQPQRIFDR